MGFQEHLHELYLNATIPGKEQQLIIVLLCVRSADPI